MALIGYLLLGLVFGVTLTKAEVVSWFRIQEMFRFQAFHMYGIIGSAIAVGAAARLLLRRPAAVALCGEEAEGKGYRYWLGGAIFGVGWALTGACPGPLFVLVGGGVTVMLVAVAGALAGTLAYGYWRGRLPH
ncbi:MAG: YeeE/YedE family protein [Bryobacterales bacterium]|nr:YeeE/YedE family protein [Bryobacterales bacterium]